jgi:uncharacterized surface protein with fasciclin (FAS1) repeats
MESSMRVFTVLTASAAALLAVASPSFAGGSKPAGNIVAAAVTSPDHKTLVAAVKAAGLVDTLASKGPFTVFAPTDSAFAKLPAGTVDTLLQPANRSTLKSVLTYHVVAGKVSASDLIAKINASGGSASLTTVQGGTLTARLDGGKVVIVDAKGGAATVVAADLMQSNGVIHVTDAVSIPG